MDKLNIYSLNVNGLGDKHKRETVLLHIKHKLQGIIMLQETHSCVEVEQTWSELTGAKCYFSHGKTDSRGVAMLVLDENVKVKDVLYDDDGRYIMMNVEHNEKQYLLLNVYAPTKDKPALQLAFFETLTTLLEDHVDKQIVAGGDFNVCLQPEIDKKGGVLESNSEVIMHLQSLLEFYDLVDIWRIRNPVRKKFSWRGRTKVGIVQSRIDYFFVSSSLANVVASTDITHGICSDHSLLDLTLGSITVNRGRGLWKFNNSLLKHADFVNSIKTYIADLKSAHYDITDKGLLWDLVKCKLRGFIMSFSIRKRKMEKQHETDILYKIEGLEARLADGILIDDDFENLQVLKQEYDLLQNERAEGMMLRAKAKWVEHGERNSKYFFQLEKRNHNVKHIQSLITDRGLVTEPKEILSEERAFYSNLYCNSDTMTETLNHSIFLDENPVRKVSEGVAGDCDLPITLDECEKALSKMANNKSPGSDGFTVEFYKHFWNEIKELVHASLMYAFNSGKLSIEQKRGVITLVPKKDKDVRLLKNWRPISLLNTDYKIITKVLASRLQNALKEIISPDQTGYIKGRNIGENIRLIDDVIQYSMCTNMKGYLVLLDFEKAFDSVNISFLKKALEIYAFGPYFRKWIEVLYTEVTSCVTNNGHFSNFFPVTKGIRQGCPISSMLFILVAELLSSYLKHCPDIRGLNIGDDIILITQLADDTTLFLKDEKSIANLLCVMDRFFEDSGLRLNKQKCEIFLLGNCGQSNNAPTHICGMRVIKGGFKALGIYFNRDRQEMVEKNFDQRLDKCQIALNIWSLHNLTLKGKITILKSIIIPNLLYPCNNLYVPDDFIKQVNEKLFKFLWSNKPPKIKQETIVADYAQGGMKMPHFPTMVKASKAMWVKRMLDTESAVWKSLAFKLCNVTKFDLNCKNDVKFIKTSSPFYRQVLDAWFTFYSTEPLSAEEIKTEIIWNNKAILIGNQPVLYMKWHEKGITFIQDLLSENGNLLSHNELMQRYDIKCHILKYLSLVKAIPKIWLKQLHSVGQAAKNKTQTRYVFMNMTSKKVYWKLMEKIVKQATAIEQWISLFPFLHDNDFKEIFCIPNTIRESKIQSFQYKLLHRIFPCNHKLYKWGIAVSPMCSFCNQIDTLEHHFFYCYNSRSFWNSLEMWFEQSCGVFIPLTITDIMFGIPYKKSQDNTLYVMNFVVMYGKWFIHKCKQDCKSIIFRSFLCYLKYVLSIERQVSINNNTITEFNNRWFNFLLNI